MTNPAQEILIIGLGLIGSSLAKATKNKGLVVHGYDLDQTTLVKATDNKIIDKAFESLEEINNTGFLIEGKYGLELAFSQ